MYQRQAWEACISCRWQQVSVKSRVARQEPITRRLLNLNVEDRWGMICGWGRLTVVELLFPSGFIYWVWQAVLIPKEHHGWTTCTENARDWSTKSTFLNFDLKGRFVVCVNDMVLFICVLDSYTEGFIYVSPVL